MTGSDMGGLFLSFVKIIFAILGVVIGVGACFTSGWLFIALAASAAVLIVLAVVIHFQLRRAEERYYESRRQTEASMRANNPFYDAFCILNETLKQAGLTHYTTGQRHNSQSLLGPEYLLVRAHVAQRDSSGAPTQMLNGMSMEQWKATVPGNIGTYMVQLDFVGP